MRSMISHGACNKVFLDGPKKYLSSFGLADATLNLTLCNK
jgi:hypothetical protein